MAKSTGIINTVKPPNNSQVHDRYFDLSSREIDPSRRFYNNRSFIFVPFSLAREFGCFSEPSCLEVSL